MKKVTLLLFIFVIFTLCSFGQEYKPSKLPFISQTSVGILLGRDLGYSYFYGGGTPIKNPPVYEQSPRTVATFSLETFNGFQYFSKTAFGLTTGVDLYRNGIMLPIALGLRHTIVEKKPRGAKIQAGLDGGYSVTWLDTKSEYEKKKGGIMISPKLSFLFPGRNGSAFLVSFAYKLQKSGSIQTVPDDDVTLTETFNTAKRFGLSVGFQF